jgi:hypothetical protein
MPTSLPVRARKRLDLVMLFVFALGTAFFAIELADPAPMDVEAALIDFR